MKLIVSFGYKYVIPTDVDKVYDTRGFYNPHRDKNLRSLNGLDYRVQNVVLSSPGVESFIQKIIADNYDFVAVGCYGGKHRSVAIVHEIARRTGVPCQHLNLRKEI